MATWTRTVKDPSPKDVVIAIIGPTGCGKSTFINWLKSSHYDDPSQPCAEACSGLKPNTKELRPYHFKLGVDRAPRRLVILDTPGLDGDPEIGKDAILDEISKWLHNTYPGYGMRLAGIVYLYPVTQARLTRFHSVCVKKLMKLCRSPSFSRIVVGTTQWTDVDLEAGAQVENALKGSQFSAAYMTRIETEKDCTKAIEYVLDAFRVEEGIISAAKRIILVLGLTGAGKSSFIQNYLGLPSNVIAVGSGLISETQVVSPYMNTAMDSRTALVDTVGFDSDGISDRETLQELVDWIDYRSSLATARCTLILLRDENHIHHRQLLQGLMRGVAEKCFVRVVTGSDPSNPSYALDENDRPRYQLNTHGAARTSHTTSLQSFCHEVANMADGQSPLSLHEVQQELTKILPKMRGPSPGFKRRSWFSKVFDYIRDTVRAHFA